MYVFVVIIDFSEIYWFTGERIQNKGVAVVHHWCTSGAWAAGSGARKYSI
jgi:hypothetical protein